jgi:RNA polymerase sigma factor (sigma-70 family)
MGMSGAALAERSGRAAGSTDHQLVGAVRCGDDRAFEQLYSRYQRRIAAYVCGMVKDYGRAEDITQEVFVSALRRMRQTERPIAFKPWIYEIAKNACIDAYRRSRRAEEVSYDADDRLSPSDYGRLVATEPEPDAAVDAKQDIDHLCGAFGGLSDSHHQILVMRELEGLSYKDIGERMGMSRQAVESTLFRARKRLGEEYDELASGARCLRIQAIVADCGTAGLGIRDQRRLARHISHCQPCRRLAVAAGLDVPVPARRRIAARVAGWLPLPAFLRLRRGGDEEAALGGGGSAWMAHAPTIADATSSGWSKLAAGLAALAVAGAGVGVSTHGLAGKRDEHGTGYRATDAAPSNHKVPRANLRATAARRGDARAAKQAPRRDGTQRGATRTAVSNGSGGSGAAAPAVGANRQAPVNSSDPAGADAPTLPSAGKSVPEADAPKAPSVDVPAAAPKLKEAVDSVTAPLSGAQETVGTTAQGVQKTAHDTTTQLVPKVTDTSDALVKPVTDTASGLLNP